MKKNLKPCVYKLCRQKLGTFSKGMKRQAALLLALSCEPDLLLLDEAFDGLDPVMRGAVTPTTWATSCKVEPV